jgi:hypothetical protein
MSDAATRLSAGEPLADLMPDLHYGVMAEVEEFLSRLLDRLQSTIDSLFHKYTCSGSAVIEAPKSLGRSSETLEACAGPEMKAT